MKKLLPFLSITLLLSINCYSQFSKTHYIPPISSSTSVVAGPQFLYVSTPSTTPVTFTITEIGGAVISGTVTRDIPYVLDITTTNPTQFVENQSDVSTVQSNKGYIVEASDMVYVTIRVIDQSGNQASELVSKGLAALGTQFRVGGFTNVLASNYSNIHFTFVSILATENNTVVNFSNIKTGAVLVNNAAVGNTPPSITLNSGQSYVMAVQGPTTANRDALIGALISSDKPIAVNCGSFGGTNAAGNLDLGFDQIVSAERTGSEYIFVKSSGVSEVERVLLIANQNNTEIYINGGTTPSYTLNAGQYVNLLGTNYSANGTMYVTTNNTTANPKTLFAYQCVGDDGRPDQANQEMFFVPPLSCQTPKVIDNIPFIETVGTRDFTGRVTITTEVGSTLSFILNSVPYTLASLPAGITVTGPTAVLGNTAFECYIITGLTGNVSVFSTSQLYLAAYGSDGAATFGGYYSGFTYKPEVNFQQVDLTQSNCIPNVELNVSSLTGFNVFQWYFNGNPITGANANNYTPTLPGYYQVKASLTACNIDLYSDEIPVSICATNMDNDLANDNIDLDNDNDGITNCIESNGDQIISLANTASGTINNGSYTNTFTGIITTSTTASATPFIGNANGSFVSDIPAGKTNWVKYTMTFAQPISLGIDYVTTANATDLLNSTAEYIINSPINKTITVLNPNNQLLIDTNYDGFYESGVTQYSSFEIRFRLNSTTPLAAGTGTFQFRTNLSNTISFTHKNLSDTSANKSTLKFQATCIPKDTDADGVDDQTDLDSDNDGILDYIEAQGANFNPISNADTNNDGIDNTFGNGITPIDSDNDGIPDYLDLDSDNDGIFDLAESGSGAIDSNLNGIIDGNFGSNGLADSIETTTDSGILNYSIANTDGDSLNNYLEIDSDDDGCNDVTEAGFIDSNNDGILGSTTPPTVSTFGTVTSGTGYGIPNLNYITAAPIAITTQPSNEVTCELESTTFTIVAATPITSYQWQLSIDNGINWINVTNSSTYSGATTNVLTINSVSPLMNGYQYRVFLNRNGNSCGLYSTAGILTTYALPVITSPITLKQCDTDTDGISDFNLTVNNPQISTNYANETFTYFTTLAGANTNDSSVQILNPTVYNSANGTVWTRVENSNGCFRVAQINLIVSVTQINAATFHRYFTVCDDLVTGISSDTDGTAVFDFSSVTNDINNQLPLPSSNYTIKYYATSADAYAQTNEIVSISNYRNTTVNQQIIYVRVDSNNFQGCYGLGPFITLTVQALPVVHTIGTNNIIRHCDDNQDGIYNFDTTSIESDLLQGQTNVIVTYFDQNGVQLSSPLPNPFPVTTSQTITVRITNNNTIPSDGPCYKEGSFQFIVDDLPQAFALAPGQLTVCDDETDPALQNGIFSFNTATIQSDILQGQTGMIVSYTLQNGTVVSSLPNPFITGTQNVIVKVTNPINPSCFASTILNFVVNPVPKIDLNTSGLANQLICTNFPTFSVTLNAGIIDGSPISNYTYQWFLNGTLVPNAINYTLTATTAGTYTVDVKNAQGCIRTRSIVVTSSVIATIQDISIIDLTDINSVEVFITGSSNGDYVYSINDPYGPYQTSPFFDNVTIGIHTIYIKDLNGCGIAEQTISVLGAPHYFTPNGDGYNDYWNIKGVNETFYSDSIIYIFDRFGKLIKQISPIGQGWDGTYNGNLAPADDYWFTLKLSDNRSAKGHFSLKR